MDHRNQSWNVWTGLMKPRILWQVRGSCIHANEPSGLVQSGEFLE
jgi:hypothetical protein